MKNANVTFADLYELRRYDMVQVWALMEIKKYYWYGYELDASKYHQKTELFCETCGGPNEVINLGPPSYCAYCGSNL